MTQPDFLPYRSGVFVLGYWLYYFLLRFFTPTGRILFLLSAFIFAYIAFTPAKAPIVFLAFSFMTFYFVSLIIGFIFRPKVYLHRTLPVFAEVGEEFLASYKLKKSWSIEELGCFCRYC